MKSRKDDYYLKNGSLDLTMLDGYTQKNEQTNKIDKNQTLEIDNPGQVNDVNYEGRYIKLKTDKISDFKGYDEVSTEQSEDMQQDGVKPYMSEEIKDLLREMGEYLLEGDDEIAVALDEEIESLGRPHEAIDSKWIDTQDRDELEELGELEDRDEPEDLYELEELDRVQNRYLEAYEDKEIDQQILAAEESSKEIDRQSFRLRQYELLEGKVLTDHIISSKSEYIGRQGEVITKYMIQLAEEKKCMIKMIMHSQ